MKNTARIFGVVALATSLVACAAPETATPPASSGSGSGSTPSGDDPSALGEVTLDLTTAPSNAQCIRLTLTPQSGSATVQLIPLTAGASTANVSIGMVPNGVFTVKADAFTAACSSIGSSAAAWTADPVGATVQPGQVTKIALTFRPNNMVSVSANFLPNIKGIAAGGFNTVLLTDAVPSAWGYAAFNNVPSALPGGLTGFTSVAAGYYHACGIRSDGTVWCWGWNIYGAVGPNVGLNSVATTPVQVPLTGAFTMIAAGGYHTCAYRPGPPNSPNQQVVFCWGYNGDGELGNGNTTSTSTPTQVNGITGLSFSNEAIRSLSAGGFHTVATLGDGHFLAWGDDRYSELGDNGTTNATSAVYMFDPVQVSTACGEWHTCSLHVDGSVWCWGANYTGQLGDGTTVNRPAMVKVPLSATAKQIVAGDNHTCALLTTGQVACWGWNTDGEIGDLTAFARFSPVPVNLGTTDLVQAIAAGSQHNCALTTTSNLYCWGYNGMGELGDGTNVDAFAPEKITLQ